MTIASGQLGCDAVDQRSGAADDVAREARPGAPDEREVAGARARRDLLGLGRGARHGRPEHQVGVAGQLAEPVGERAVVSVREQAPARLGGRLAGARPGHALVARDGDAQPRARARERDALGRPQREAQRIQLGPAADEQPPVELERDEVARHGHGLDADIGDEPAGRRAGPAEDVRAEVQPVRVARLAADAPAEPAGALEHDDVAVAQVPGGREPGDAATDHDRVAHGLAAGCGVLGRAGRRHVRHDLVRDLVPSGAPGTRRSPAARTCARDRKRASCAGAAGQPVVDRARPERQGRAVRAACCGAWLPTTSTPGWRASTARGGGYDAPSIAASPRRLGSGRRRVGRSVACSQRSGPTSRCDRRRQLVSRRRRGAARHFPALGLGGVDALPRRPRPSPAPGVSAALYGFNEGIDNHFSLAVPGRGDCFLLNPYGPHWSELRASDLLTISLGGERLAGDGELDVSAFTIHLGAHRARPLLSDLVTHGLPASAWRARASSTRPPSRSTSARTARGRTPPASCTRTCRTRRRWR